MEFQFDHISLYVKDLSISKQFYEGFLKLKPIPRPNFDFEGIWYHLGGNVQLHLIAGRTDSAPASGSRKNHFALVVDDIDLLSNKAIQKNFPVVGPKLRADGAWHVFIQDPDGYFIEFTKK